MAPRKKTAATPKKLKQKKLDAFLGSSSPAAASSTHNLSSPTRPTHRGRRQRRISNEHVDPPADEEEGSQSSDPGAIHFESAKVGEASSSEDEAYPALRPTQASKRKKHQQRAHSEDSLSAIPSDSDEQDHEVFVRKGKRAVKKTSTVLVSDEEEEARPVKRRKLVKGERPQTPEDDEADLLKEVDEERIIESRLRTRDKRSAFQKNLEKLKRRKRGQAQPESSAEEDEDGDDDAVPFAHARPDDRTVAHEAEEDDEGEEGFIVEDDEQAVELPAEFSMNTYQDLLHHFKIVCQLFVHMAVHDADEREEAATRLQNNQYFEVPLKITRRKLSGMRDSLVAGSTWKPQFRKALDKYPTFELYNLEFTVLGCDACHLGGRKSTLQGRLSGSPYDPLTYETAADSESEDSDGEKSTKLKQFDLGRFCAKRTRTYHRFTHWEYHLFHALRDEVEALQASREGGGYVQVAYVNGKEPPEDLKDADAIMDWLDQRQIIAIQWQEIKTMMESARHLEVKVGRGGEMDSD
ncbi:hypothetical protein C8Q74DRAFT_1188043 [Fomes fomentarius]|nr:hypothetical protein C8Q74DRAFT_1188043 [Fomes fomentarius]